MPASPRPDSVVPDDTIAAVRRYNRFYHTTAWSAEERCSKAGGRSPGAGALRHSRTVTRLSPASLHRPHGPTPATSRGSCNDSKAPPDRAPRDGDDARRSHVLLTPAVALRSRRSTSDSRMQVARLLAPLPSPGASRARDVDVHDPIACSTGRPPRIPRSLRCHAARACPRRRRLGCRASRCCTHRDFGYKATFERAGRQDRGLLLESHDASRRALLDRERAGARVGAVFLVRLDDANGEAQVADRGASARGLAWGHGW